MAPKSATILFAVLSVLAVAVPIIAAATAAAPRSPRAGGYQPIADADLNSPDVIVMAKWAVAVHNKEKKTSLVFVSVVKGEWQVVEGANYRLVISAKDGAAAAPKTYTAVIYKDPRGAPSLISFA